MDSGGASILVGTCLARSSNEIRELNYDLDSDALTAEATHKCPAEVWGLCSAVPNAQKNTRNNNYHRAFAVAARRSAQSCLEVWSLPGRQSPDDAEHGSTLESVAHHDVEVVASVGVESKVRAVVSSGADDESLLVTHSNGGGEYTLDASQGSIAKRSSIVVDSTEDLVIRLLFSKVQNTTLVATRDALFTHDTRSQDGDRCHILGPLSKSQRDSSNPVSPDTNKEEGSTNNYDDESNCFWEDSDALLRGDPKKVCPRRLRITAAGVGHGYLVVVGDEDGGVTCGDIRSATNRRTHDRDPPAVWTIPDTSAHAQWVSSISVGPGDAILSGGTDGVVRVWSSTGGASGTYPQHNDTVYGTSWVANGAAFVSVSYDGRLAGNLRPIGLSQ